MAETFDKKNVLVTGGAGFIGSHLCERLLEDGAKVICIDNFITSHVRNIDALLANQDFQFLRLDIAQPFDLEKFDELKSFKVPFNGIQEIYHLACPMSIKNFDQFKVQTLLANSTGNYNVLEIAKKYKSKILLSSSSVVYGSRTDDKIVFDESHKGLVDHLTPRACYDEGRRFSETMFETYRLVFGLDVKISRIFRTYGPKMPLFDGQLIPDFVLDAINGKDLVIYGDEDFQTSLCYIDDMIDGLIRHMKAPEGNVLMNFGSDVDVKMADVANMIIDMVGSTSKVTYQDSLEFLTELALPDISVAKEMGWLPLTRLQDGLQKTIEYVKANHILLTEMG